MHNASSVDLSTRTIHTRFNIFERQREMILRPLCFSAESRRQPRASLAESRASSKISAAWTVHRRRKVVSSRPPLSSITLRKEPPRLHRRTKVDERGALRTISCRLPWFGFRNQKYVSYTFCIRCGSRIMRMYCERFGSCYSFCSEFQFFLTLVIRWSVAAINHNV